MANHYRSVLESGGGVQPTGDAVAADVLTGKTFSNANAVGIAGTMPNRGAVSGQATPSQPYTIPAGYHNGNGVVTAANEGSLESFTFRFEAGVGRLALLVTPSINEYISNNPSTTFFSDSEYFGEDNGWLIAKKACTIVNIVDGVAGSATQYSANQQIFQFPTSNIPTHLNTWNVTG